MTTITLEKAIVHRALSALEYHTQQTRPIHNTELVIEELRTALSAPATAPERKPMPILEVNARWEQSVLDIPRLQYYQVVREVEAFHGIKEDKP